MTASHCVTGKIDINIVVGAHDKSKPEFTQQRSVAKQVIMHPNYGKGSDVNADIALIELKTPLKLNDRVVRACMPKEGVYPKKGTNCYIAGEFM